MVVSLKHAFNSAKADGTDSTLIQPSNWNAEHVLQLATNRLLGRTTAGTGAAEEISVSAALTLAAGILGLAANQSFNSLTVGGVAGGVVSVGTIVALAIDPTSVEFPADVLECNGAAISRTTYATLFAKIGTVFGAGDGTTTFNLPDLRGVDIRGYDHGRGLDTGRVFGSYQADAYASHTHGVTDPGHAHSISDPGHIHTVAGQDPGTGGSVVATAPLVQGNQFKAPSDFSTRSSTTGVGVIAAGTGISVSSSGASETRSKNVALTLAIKY